MCLELLFKKTTFEKAGEGFKVVRKDKRGNYYCHLSGDRGKSLPMGEWINEHNFRSYQFITSRTIHELEDVAYSFGWHVWESLRAAKEWLNCMVNSGLVVIRVRYRKVVAKGRQETEYHNRNVTVAQEIYIEEEVYADT